MQQTICDLCFKTCCNQIALPKVGRVLVRRPKTGRGWQRVDVCIDCLLKEVTKYRNKLYKGTKKGAE